MKTNHPAHGPVSLDRLHQIREHLLHDNQYSNGGNRAYILADMLKVVDEVLASRTAEPVAWTEKCEITNMQATGLYLRGFPDNSHGRDIALYTAPPAPVVDADDNFYSWFGREWEQYYQPNNYSLSAKKHLGAIAESAWFACRAAMLQAGNSPAIPDGWVMVPVEPTAEMISSGIAAHYERNQIQIHDRPAPGPMECAYEAMLAAAPQQEVKS
ncbi:hypothetical protein CRY23_01450 [Salmonella enterica]|uniref:hypothetical protein n=1 Tax=Salmonella enterica TaxID=28901 RepID=UPI0010BEFE22|nr:hypothetical protein [Salmonella enterica]EAO9833302.1 hypothetical protein [Salmonella enterica]EBB9997556.1 hypothetical protein [Salmonella enterica]EBE5684792.1 hypothetical protein [Salmonella enterica]EBU4845120.1 hypothetical protein [Salmonella enterica]EKE3488895.1 hypothetical protein [Salmonella enterica]